jgi:hypothetical protein
MKWLTTTQITILTELTRLFSGQSQRAVALAYFISTKFITASPYAMRSKFLSRVRTLRGRLARLPQPSVASDVFFRTTRQAWEAARTAVHARQPFWREARAAVQSERATRSEAPLSTTKNRIALARPAATSIRGKRRGEAGIHFASLAARGRLYHQRPFAGPDASVQCRAPGHWEMWWGVDVW